jgi:hypothetical protein
MVINIHNLPLGDGNDRSLVLAVLEISSFDLGSVATSRFEAVFGTWNADSVVRLGKAISPFLGLYRRMIPVLEVR